MKQRIFLEHLQQLERGSRVCIYGCGETGTSLKHHIEKMRQDISIPCFLDSFKRGSKEGIEIITPEALPQIMTKFDAIIIASQFWNQIEANLVSLGINKPTFIMSNYMIFQLSPLSQFGDYYFESSDVTKELKEKINKTRSLFSNQQDRQLYDVLIGLRTKGDQERASNHILKHVHPKSMQYFEFLEKEKVQVIIEGGVFDGADTHAFSENFPSKDLIIYGFEPFIEYYNNGKFKNLLIGKNVKIFPCALSDKTGSLEMEMPDDINSGSIITANKEKTGRIRTVRSVTGDSFVHDNNIPRVDFIKLDVEGYEKNIILGLEKTIKSMKPQLAISVYHQKNDIIDIPPILHDMNPTYSFHIGHYSPCFVDSVLYAIPRP